MTDLSVVYELLNKCCKNCEYYKDVYGICGGEVLPIERAIANNMKGRGLCGKIKEAMKGDTE